MAAKTEASQAGVQVRLSTLRSDPGVDCVVIVNCRLDHRQKALISLGMIQTPADLPIFAQNLYARPVILRARLAHGFYQYDENSGGAERDHREAGSAQSV